MPTDWESFDAVIVMKDGTLKHVKGSRGGLIKAARHVKAVRLIIQLSATEAEEVSL